MQDETAEPRDPNHIWLRQSVTFTLDGQTRTLEMALPLRPGATPEEVEALLDEADAGMRRLSRRLDAHLAELTGPRMTVAPERLTSEAPPETPPATTPPTPRAPAPATTPSRTAPTATQPAPTQPASTQPASPAAAQPSGPDLTIPAFIAQAAALGYDSREAMARLGVRSLSGLNLREGLESLRRQALRDGSSPPSASRPPLAFEEEEDSAALTTEPEMELSYADPASVPDDDEDEEDPLAGEASAPPAPTAPDESAPAAPDLNALRRDGRLTSAAKLPAPAPRRSGPLATGDAIAETPAAPLTPAPEETPAQRADSIIAELRAAHTGGAPSGYQREAFHHLVVGQLDDRRADALTKLIWKLPPDQLGPEQLEALIRWGKRDDFVEEVREVVAKIRAGHGATKAPAAEETPAPPARGARPARQRSAPPAEGGRGEG